MSTDVTPSGTTLTEKVAEEIRAWMGRRKMSQAELARRLTVSKMWVSYRLGGVQPIDLNDLEHIARALDVSIVELLPRELVRPNERSAQVTEQMTPAAASAPASAERLTRCIPDVRSSPGEGTRRRPKVRQSAGRPIPAHVAA